MKKQNENYFADKFRLLDSQETSEEISWSCSDSSDNEDQQNKLINITYGKRKKGYRKRKELKNISNLDITIGESINERNSCTISAKSPILAGKLSTIKSPILTPSQSFLPRYLTNNAVKDSPVLSNRTNICNETRNVIKSPIILDKRESPRISPKVKKKLFETAQSPRNSEKIAVSTRSTSPILSSHLDCLDRRKNTIQPIEYFENNATNQANRFRITERTTDSNEEQTKRTDYVNEDQRIPFLNISQTKIASNQPDTFRITKRIKSSNEEQDSNLSKGRRNSKFEISIQSSSSDSSTNISRTELVSRVKSYFDNYFSSQTSNHSISEYETPTPKSLISSEENINEITQVKSLSPTLNDAQTTSFGSNTNTTKKKIKYKKGGLSYRLNALLKKQNASISLWQHERFLAANSSFVIPKEEFLAFRIKNVDFNFNIHSMEVVNENNEPFLIVINSIHVNNNTFGIDDVLKVYKPYHIIESKSNCKVIVNVCKFECRKLN